MSNAGTAAIYALLLSLVVTEGTRLEGGGRCMAVHRRLAKLRAEITEVEQEAEACSAGVTSDARLLPLPAEAAESVGDADTEQTGAARESAAATYTRTCTRAPTVRTHTRTSARMHAHERARAHERTPAHPHTP